MDPLINFTAQAATGVFTSYFRIHGQLPKNPQSTLMLVHYLNIIWNNIILRDDNYVNEVFDRIEREMPNESPVCLMWKIMQVARQIVDEFPPIICNQVDTLRSVLMAYSKSVAAEKYKILYNENHQCTGKSFAQIRAEGVCEPFFHIG